MKTEFKEGQIFKRQTGDIGVVILKETPKCVFFRNESSIRRRIINKEKAVRYVEKGYWTLVK